MIGSTSLFGGVWAMVQTHVPVVCQRLAGMVGNATAAAAVAAAAAEDRERAFETTGTVAVIPIVGEIFPRANLYTWFYGGATLDRIKSQFRKALADDAIKAIVFRVDSPGGLADGCTEFAGEVLKARGVKPIAAIADTLMASAAYWIAAAADEVSASPSAHVGSIGCYTEHEDISRMLDESGVTVTLVASDERKIEGNRYQPLTDEAKAQLKAFVDQIAGMFRNDVAKGRGVTVSVVKERFGEGRVFGAKDAKESGLVDRVETFDQLLVRLAGSRRSGVRADATVSGSSLSDGPSTADAPAQKIGESVGLSENLIVVSSVPHAETDEEAAVAVAREQAHVCAVIDSLDRVAHG